MNGETSSSWKARASMVALVAALLVSGIGPGMADPAVARNWSSAKKVQTFQDTAPILIFSNSMSRTASITVSGFDTPIADVNVSLNVLTHPNASDLDIVLIGPGEQTALIMSDAGGPAQNDSLILDDQAANQLPPSDPLASGIVQPTNYDYTTAPDTFTPPAPANPSSGSALAVFNGADANGAWLLFVNEQDNLPVENGSLAGGWNLQITTASGVPATESESFQTQAGRTLTVPASGVLANDSDPDGDALTAVLAGQPRKGQVTLEADGSFAYRANKKAKGVDSFTYLARDTAGLSALETVTIQVKGKKHKKHKN